MPEGKFIKELEITGIIDVIGDPISIQDTDFKIIYQNKRHKDIVGDKTGEYCYKAYQNKDHVCKDAILQCLLRTARFIQSSDHVLLMRE